MEDVSPKPEGSLREALRLLATRRFAAADRKPALIIPGIYIGSVGAAANRDALRRLGITHVLCAASGLTPDFPDEFQYLSIDLKDRGSARLEEYFAPCFEFIDESLTSVHGGADSSAPGGVLIHCFQGRSRSAAVAVAWLMRSRGMKFLEALELVRAARPIVQPNPGFAAQLLAYERRLAHSKETTADTRKG